MFSRTRRTAGLRGWGPGRAAQGFGHGQASCCQRVFWGWNPGPWNDGCHHRPLVAGIEGGGVGKASLRHGFRSIPACGGGLAFAATANAAWRACAIGTASASHGCGGRRRSTRASGRRSLLFVAARQSKKEMAACEKSFARLIASLRDPWSSRRCALLAAKPVMAWRDPQNGAESGQSPAVGMPCLQICP